MIPSLQDLEDLVQEARRAGARGVEILTSETESVQVRGEPRTRPTTGARTTSAMTVRCWIEGGRRGVAEGTPDAFPALVQQACAAAAKAPEDPYGGPIRQMATAPRGLGIDDVRHHQISLEDRLDVVTSNQKAADKADPAVRASAFGYRDERTLRRFANSNGVALEAAATSYEAWGAVNVTAGGQTLTLSEHTAGRAFASIACMPFGALLAQRGKGLIPDAPPLDGPIRVLLPPRATGKLIAWLAEFFTIQHREAGDTFVAAASVEPLFHHKLHLVDDAGLSGGLRTRGFDDRGVTPAPLNLIREGMVAAHYLDPESARRLDMRPTGHVWGDQLRPSNLQLNSGARSINAWLGEQDQQVFQIDDLPDLTGIDPRTGDLDLVVHGTLHHRHEVLGARRGVRVHGNLLTALAAVHGVTSDTDRIGHVDAPGVFLDGLSVQG